MRGRRWLGLSAECSGFSQPPKPAPSAPGKPDFIRFRPDLADSAERVKFAGWAVDTFRRQVVGAPFVSVAVG